MEQTNPPTDGEAREISFEDAPASHNPTATPTHKTPLDFLPGHLRGKGSAQPPGKEYQVLQLKPEGEGHNASLLSLAITMFNMGVGFDDALDHLYALYSQDRADYRSAPLRAIKRVWECEGDMDTLAGHKDDADRPPDAREDALVRFRRTSSQELLEASPVKSPTLARTGDIIKSLFDPSDIINIQETAREVGTLTKLADAPTLFKRTRIPAEKWAFINPSTFKKVEGVANPKDGNKISTRCNANVKKRPYMLLEMDAPDRPDQVERFTSFALAMARFAPLKLAVATGGKSIHFWFDATHIDAQTRTGFFNLACLHGADPRMAVKSQIARMPNVPAAEDGRDKQEALYWDPRGMEWPKEGDAKVWELAKFEEFLKLNKQIEFYYHGKAKAYLTRDDSGGWVQLDRNSAKMQLGEKGFRTTTVEGEIVSPADSMINKIQTQNSLNAILGASSGRQSGYYEENGNRFIVLNSPRRLKPRKGYWGTLEAFLLGQFGEYLDPEPYNVFLGWNSASLRDLWNDGRRVARFSQAQMFHLIGKGNTGKSLLLDHILRPMYNDRACKADPMFQRNEPTHNAEMFERELLYLDDSRVLGTSMSDRQDFGERIKEVCVSAGGGAGYRAMQQDRVMIRPWWRIVRMMNDEPAKLATLPPLDDGIADKLILCRSYNMLDGPFAKFCQKENWFDRFMVKLHDEGELSAFYYYLLNEHEIQEEHKDPGRRYAVKSYKDPDIVAELEQGEPHTVIQGRIDGDARGALFFPSAGFGDDGAGMARDWTGSCGELYEILCNVGNKQSQIRFSKICPTPSLLLQNLRRLEDTGRVSYSARTEGVPTRRNGREYWIVHPDKLWAGEDAGEEDEEESELW